jgi:hypothetical protein
MGAVVENSRRSRRRSEEQFAIIAHSDVGGVIEPDLLRAWIPPYGAVQPSTDAQFSLLSASRNSRAEIRRWLFPSANVPFDFLTLAS